MILLVGGQGFVGSAFCRLFTLRGLAHDPITRDTYGAAVGRTGTVLINAAANSRKYLADQDWRADFEASVESVLRTISDFSVERYVLLSSVDVYNVLDDPGQNGEDAVIDPLRLSTYGFHKYIAEACVRRHAPRWLIVRLAGVAARMDRSEDILFLFLSSHGSEQHELAVDLEPLPLQSLPAERLAGLLDELEFGWRVVVVSACFSGGFLEPLRNDHTLVLTASRADRMSFGCSDDAEFTYFGQAFLRDALAHEPSFVAAFEQARRAIAQREEREHFEHSEPQIATSPAIEAKLAEWLATLPAAPAARAGAR